MGQPHGCSLRSACVTCFCQAIHCLDHILNNLLIQTASAVNSDTFPVYKDHFYPAQDIWPAHQSVRSISRPADLNAVWQLSHPDAWVTHTQLSDNYRHYAKARFAPELDS